MLLQPFTAKGTFLMSQRRKRKTESRIFALFIAVSLLCISLIVMTAASFYIKYSREELFSGIEGIDSSAKSAGGFFSPLLGQNPEDTFSYEIKEKIVFDDADSAGEILLKNPDKNRYLMQMTLIVNGKSVLKTGYIPPGNMIETARLERELKKGKYQAVALIEAVSPENGSVVGQLKQPVEVILSE